MDLSKLTNMAIELYRPALLVLAGAVDNAADTSPVIPPALPSPAAEIQFLSVDEVKLIHELQMVAISPDEPRGILNAGQLEAAVMAPQQTFGGEFFYPTFADMAAAYWIGLVGGHAFQQGNKRVSFLSTLLFLWQNGILIDLQNAEAASITLRIIAHELDRENLSSLLAKKL